MAMDSGLLDADGVLRLKRKLKVAQLPSNGSRSQLERRFDAFRKKTLAEAGLSSSDEEDGDDKEDEDDAAQPALVMVDHQCGNRYMRVVDQKGMGEGQGDATGR